MPNAAPNTVLHERRKAIAPVDVRPGRLASDALAELQRRARDGEYDSADVADAVARKLLYDHPDR